MAVACVDASSSTPMHFPTATEHGVVVVDFASNEQMGERRPRNTQDALAHCDSVHIVTLNEDELDKDTCVGIVHTGSASGGTVFTFDLDGDTKNATRFESKHLMVGTPVFPNNRENLGGILKEAWWEHKDTLLSDFLKRIGSFSKLKQWPPGVKPNDKRITVMCVHAGNFLAALNFVCSASERKLDLTSLVVFTCSPVIAAAMRVQLPGGADQVMVDR